MTLLRKNEWAIFARAFTVTALILVTVFCIAAYLNMVVRMGIALSPSIFIGPIFLGLLSSILLSAFNLIYYLKLTNIEKEKNRELEETQLEVIMTLTEVAESRCSETGAHIKRVSEYSRLLGQLCKLPEQEINYVAHASPLHDIGKIGITDSILLKPGKLTPEEFVIMKSHSEIGYRILADSTKPILKAGAIIAQQHHERWDGKGYPNGLAGENIHIYGRIVAIADVFDALASVRPYKHAWPLADIIELFTEQRGLQFDPHLTDLFLQNIDRFDAIRLQYQDNATSPLLSV